jgi:hypothetical protein
MVKKEMTTVEIMIIAYLIMERMRQRFGLMKVEEGVGNLV